MTDLGNTPMQERFLARLKIIGAVFFFYFLPWMALAFYTGWMLSPAERWTFLPIALCAILVATLLLVFCIKQFEHTLETLLNDLKTDQFLYSSLKAEGGQEAGDSSLEAPYVLLYEETLQQLKNEQASCKELKEHVERQEQRYAELEGASLAEKAALQAALEEEQECAAGRQKQVIQLEKNAYDLKYEMKALIESMDRPTDRFVERSGDRSEDRSESQVDFDLVSSFSAKPLNAFLHPVSTLSSAESQLKLCVDIAQKFTGARHLTQTPFRSHDPSAQGYDLDLRRLTDTLLSVSGRPILLYHQKEGRLLFISPHIKQMLGSSPEKYVQDFSSLFPEGQEQWDEILRQLPLLGMLELSKNLVTNAGELVPIVFHLGWIPAGIFKAHVIGVMEKAP